jgi:hypothetical protein
MEKFHQIPKTAVQNRVASGYIKIGNTAGRLTHILTVFNDRFHFRPRHFPCFETGVSGKNIAVSAALVAAVGYMPLKSKIFHVCIFTSIKKVPTA